MHYQNSHTHKQQQQQNRACNLNISNTSKKHPFIEVWNKFTEIMENVCFNRENALECDRKLKNITITTLSTLTVNIYTSLFFFFCGDGEIVDLGCERKLGDFMYVFR